MFSCCGGSAQVDIDGPSDLTPEMLSKLPTRKKELQEQLATARKRCAELEIELESHRDLSEASAASVQSASTEAREAGKAAAKEKGKAAAPKSPKKAGDKSEGWCAAKWIDALSPICYVIADALLSPLGDVTTSQNPNSDVELAFVRAIGRMDALAGTEAVLRLLRNGPFLGQMASELYKNAYTLANARAATATELQSKFLDESAFTLAYGGMDTFFGGLEKLLGPPSPQLEQAMKREHCASADSKEFFTSGNYGVTTTSQIEWYFVFDPNDGLSKLHGVVDDWPEEQMLIEAARKYRIDKGLGEFSLVSVRSSSISRQNTTHGDDEAPDEEVPPSSEVQPEASQPAAASEPSLRRDSSEDEYEDALH